MPRLFTGLEIPERIALRLSMIKARISGAKWIDKENYHITLRFAGDIDERQARDFADALDEIRLAPFSASLEGFGSFGGRKPRSLWAGVAPSAALCELQAAHERAARRAGLSAEGRNFAPHITLARLKGVSSHTVASLLEDFGGYSEQSWDVSQFVLYSSKPSRGGGPYLVEEIFPLG